MAVDMKKILADGLLELCTKKDLRQVSIKEILAKTGVSRQTFYNHFLDKEDLICYVYDKRIIPEFDLNSAQVSFYDALLADFYRMKEHHVFLKQALAMEGVNSLKNHMYRHAQDFDLKWHQKAYGSQPLPDALAFATTYHASASVSMTLSWILGDMPVPPEEIVELITRMRSIGMEKLFATSKDGINPYHSRPASQPALPDESRP